jgi:site-specific DNA-methyltransferase (adenine-specific)
MKPFYKSEDKNFYLLHGDVMDILSQFEHKFDMVFADPPYFLSNDGFSVQNGQIVVVNKGKWDRSGGFECINEFNKKWLTLIREKMKEDATIWISGTIHNIFSVGQLLTSLGFKILNMITWEKSNPPPNFSCRYFTHSTEYIIWARKNENVPHYFNYELMKELNGGRQMKDVWKLPAIASWEKSCGKHPTQKPLSLLTRLILASTKSRAWVLDPFTGSSTTGISANLINRRFLGIDQEEEFLEISRKRKLEIEDPSIAAKYKQKLRSFKNIERLNLALNSEPIIDYSPDLEFDLNLNPVETILKKDIFRTNVDKVIVDKSLQVSKQVKSLVNVLESDMSRLQLMSALNIKSKYYFVEKYLRETIETGLIELTQPDSPSSPTQKYRLTKKGEKMKKTHFEE